MFNVGIYSSAMRMGKSETAKYFVKEYKYNMLTFAEPMKDMIGVVLKGLGYGEDKIYEMLYGNLKELVIPELGVTPRFLLVTLGSKWGRGMINDDMWIKIALGNLDPNLRYVCEDVRLLNEAEHLREKGFKIIRVINPRIPLVESISEGKLDDYSFDHVIMNDGSIEDLHEQIENIVCKDWGIVYG